jgi:general secretion pathway protein K
VPLTAREARLPTSIGAGHARPSDRTTAFEAGDHPMTAPLVSHLPSVDGHPRGIVPRTTQSECLPPFRCATTRGANASWAFRARQEQKDGSIGHSRNILQFCGTQGSALLIVVVLLGTVAALAVVMSRSVSSAAMEAKVLLDEGRAEIALRSGIDVGVAAILQLGLRVRVAETSVDLTDSQLFVRASNESARIDLNKSPRPLLAGLISESGVDPRAADALAERIVDWRDGPRAQQAGDRTVSLRDDPSTRTAMGQGIAARVFVHPLELASINGFSNALVARMLPFLTVANTVGNIDPDLASDQVLAALGASPERIDAFREARRRGATSRETAIELLGIAKSLVTADAARGWRIEITSTPRSGRVRQSEAVVVLLNSDIVPYRLLYVMDDADALALNCCDERPN